MQKNIKKSIKHIVMEASVKDYEWRIYVKDVFK